MERFIFCCLLAVAMTATFASGTYSSRPFMPTGFGWGYGFGHPVMRMGLNFGGFGIGRPGFALPVAPISLGYGYRPFSYRPFGSGYGFGGYRYGYPRYGGGLFGRYYDDIMDDDDDDDDRFWPYSGIEDWNLDGFDILKR